MKTRPKLKPPLKWVGGKQQWAPLIVEAFRQASGRPRATCYAEPFVGGGAVALQIAAEGAADRIAIDDANPALRKWWQAVLEEPDWLIAHATDWATRLHRDPAGTWIGLRIEARIDPAAFQVAVRAAFRGLWRVNAADQPNAPLARPIPSIKTLAQADAIMRAHAALERACIGSAMDGDWVYLDPPYLGTWCGYTAAQWTQEDQDRLIAQALGYMANGATVLINQPLACEAAWIAAGARRVGLFPRPERMQPKGAHARNVDLLLALGGAR